MTTIEAVMESPGLKRVMPIATRLHPDEKAYWLWEVIVQSRGNRGWRRAQVIYVNRGGEMARFAQDLGPADAFEANEISIPSLWEHSVAQLREMAERMRADNYWQKFLEEQMAEDTLIPDAIAAYHERRAQIRNRSIMGPHFTRQRNSFSQATAARKAREVRNGTVHR